MPKVLVLATSRHTHGGISSVVTAHERSSQWREHSCRWIATHRSGSMLTKLRYLVSGMLQYIWYLPWCKVVHVHVGHGPSARRKRLFVRLASVFGKKVIVQIHADTTPTIYGPSKDAYAYLFEKADLVLLLSERWKSALDKFCGRKVKSEILYNPCPAVKPSETDPESKYILSAGVLDKNKGYHDLITAFASVARQFPDWKLCFAGSGEIDRARTLAAELGIASQVEFKGWVTGVAKDSLFRKASIFCLSSYAEGFPMAVLEAWAYALPVVATPVGGLPDIVTDGKEALLFDPGDCAALAQRLERLMGDPVLRVRLGSESLRMAYENFNVENIGRQLGAIYDSLLLNE